MYLHIKKNKPEIWKYYRGKNNLILAKKCYFVLCRLLQGPGLTEWEMHNAADPEEFMANTAWDSE
jgi:hypothetical protein